MTILLGNLDKVVKQNVKSETPFTDWVREKGRSKSKLAKFIEASELEDELDKLVPESFIPEVEGKPIENFQASWKEGQQIKVIKGRPMQIISYEPKKNPYLIQLSNISHAKLYWSLEDFDLWFYVFSADRKHIIRKLKFEHHDVKELLAVCLWFVYGDDLPKKIWIGKKLRQRILKLHEKTNPNEPFHFPKYLYVNKELRDKVHEIEMKVNGFKEAYYR